MSTLSCGCEYEVVPSTYWEETNQRTVRVNNLVRYSRRCAKHSRARKRKPVRVPSRRGWPRPSSATQEFLYAQLMGRPWADPDPRPADFGAPEYPEGVPFADRETWEAYHAAYLTWSGSDGHVSFQAAWNKWHTRRAQFDYTGRDKSVIEHARVS